MSRAESMYIPYRKHPALFGDTFLEDWLHDDMKALVETFSPGTSTTTDAPEIASPLMQQETTQVYSFNCLSNEFLRIFRDEIDHFYRIAEKHRIPVKRPNSMNNYGVIVNDIGMRPIITSFQQLYLSPISQHLFPQQSLPKFDSHHSFLVRYNADEDLGLDMHIDDSDVTFNVCLGDTFTGATLTFCGDFGKPHHRQRTFQYRHQIGRAVLHLGSRRHGADDIDSGTRTNLIIWNQNQEWRMSPHYRGPRSTHYEPEQGPPDPVCLSYTHDRDYTFYQPYPARARNARLQPWCPPRGKEYEGYHKRLMETSPMGDQPNGRNDDEL